MNIKTAGMPAIDVTCAVIRNDADEVLVVQKGANTDHPLKWEFPGGKTEAGETHEECILREIREELDMEIVIVGKLPAVQHRYPSKNIRLIPFICDTLDRQPLLTEHVAFRWVGASRLMHVDFAHADIAVAGSYTGMAVQSPPCNAPGAAASLPDFNGCPIPEGLTDQSLLWWAVAEAEHNPQVTGSLIEASLSDKRQQAFHSSWALTKVFERYPLTVYPHLDLLAQLLSPALHDSAQRTFLRIISDAGLRRTGAKHHGAVADFCFNAIKQESSAIAVKAYALEVLSALSAIYPELENELLATIGMMHGSHSPAVKAKIKQITGIIPRSAEGERNKKLPFSEI